ncbi:predicted protein [Botrytis cinerea T4]|uniref:Uncharacterized protein n=1 Tax=Botryotinia fuckeliana (strain T4) TaxID=999810 RepID=G2Y1V9_BOTF4|nr:predicted protein [Botrytis cinerea T4]
MASCDHSILGYCLGLKETVRGKLKFSFSSSQHIFPKRCNIDEESQFITFGYEMCTCGNYT